MRQIWNEGRVVGLSAYEIYVRHMMSEFGDNTHILTEREWLASTLGDGISMILKIPSGTKKGIVEYTLPSNSLLCGCTGIISASIFNGSVEVDKDGWATKVNSYGPIYESTDGNSVENLENWDISNLSIMKDFIKIVDGVVYQPSVEGVEPYKPDLTKNGVIRLRISEDIVTDVYVLFTGFLNKQLVLGLYKLDSNPLVPENPQNGDFLGPEMYPWATKIIFSVPNEVYQLINRYSYTREFKIGETSKSVESKSIIDFESKDPNEYYEERFRNSKIPINVERLTTVDDKGASVLGTYQLHKYYPPALYGAKVTETGDQTISPIDIVSPGSVKVFEDRDVAMTYPDAVPNVYSIYMDKDNDDMYLIDEEAAESGELPVPIGPKIETVNEGTDTSPKYISRTFKGNTSNPREEIKSISYIDTDGNDLNTDGTNGEIVDVDKINWTTLLLALGANKVFDLLGEALRGIKNNGVFDLKGTGQNKLSGGLDVSKVIKTGKNYIEFNGLRLYISSSVPTDSDIPVGSIGIGWTE